jgi:act minimal PKS acyl carrier protein
LKDLTVEDFKRIMHACAGEVESLYRDAEMLDMSFVDLGCDSLALLEAAAVIWREYGVELADEDLDVHETPRAFLGKVNGILVSQRFAG